MGLREQHRDERRSAILDALSERLAERGIDEISVDELAQAVSLSRGTVFNYFESKHDMLASLAAREVTLLERRYGSGLGRENSIDALTDMMFSLVATSFGAPRVAYRVLKALLDDAEAPNSPVFALLALIESLLEIAQSNGELRDNIDLSAAARAIFGTYVAELFFAQSQGTPSTIELRSDFTSSAELILRGVLCPT